MSSWLKEDQEATKDDSPSSVDTTSSWVDQHADIAGVGAEAPGEEGQMLEESPKRFGAK